MSLAAALAIVATLAHSTSVEAASARIVADGDCLNMRQTPSLTSPVLTCLGDGVVVTTVPGTVTADGLDWQQVRTTAGTGWVAARYLIVVPDGAPQPSSPTVPSTPPVAPTVPTAARPFEVPPVGGMTLGYAGTSSPEAVVAAQTFPVAGLTAIDPLTQRYLTYIPGAPAFVNTLDSATLRADTVVMVRRTGTLPPSDTSPMPSAGLSATAGAPSAFVAPSRGGLTLGVSGTNDLAAVLKAQTFAVDVVMALEVPTQRWLTYIPGAPDWVSTLNSSTLRPTSVLFIRRSLTAPDPTPPAPPAVATVKAPITYYYCTQTSTSGAGDGGGFCGSMRDGSIVHPGAASCDSRYFGQRFRVVGDPTNMIYSCADTGGGVSAEHRDIWFATSGEAWAWWKQVAPTGYATVEVLGESPVLAASSTR